MWADRNKAVHGETKEEANGILKQKLLLKAKKHKADTPFINKNDEEYQNISLDQLELMPTSQIMTWLQNMTTLRKINIAQVRANTEEMKSWEPPALDIYAGSRDVQSGLYTSTLKHGSRYISQ
jgi:hypothetical protein